MKIVYCLGSLYQIGGTEQVLANKANYFVDKLGYEIHIVTENQRGLPLGYEFDKRIIFHDIGEQFDYGKVFIKGLTFLNNVFTLRKIFEKLFKEINPDIIIVLERGYLDYVIPFVNKEIPKIREFHFSKEAVKVHASTMTPWHQGLIHNLRYKFIFKMFNKYDYLVLLTNREKERGNYKTNMEVIPNMIPNRVTDEKSNLSSKRVISVGSMDNKRKGFDVQIKLWKDIVEIHPDWVLDIYGDGMEKSNLQELINVLNLKNNVILHGNSNKMPKHYLESSIFLFTSVAEGLPMVLIEALSFGLPCVSFDCPTGPSDIISENVDGFVVEQGDLKNLKEKLLLLIENNELRLSMGAKAHQNAKRFFPENISKHWESFFKQVKSKNEN